MQAHKLLDVHPLLADRVRLAIMVALASSDKPIDFSSLLASLELSRGNLSTHITKLEKEGFIMVTKEFVERRPRTTYHCTDRGRAELRNYLATVEAALKGFSAKDEA